MGWFRSLAFLAALLVVGVLAATANAVTLQSSTPMTQPWQQWANQSYMPTNSGTIPFSESPTLFPCGAIAEAAGCTVFTVSTTDDAPASDISIEVWSGDTNTQQYLLHELGQAFDAEYLTDADKLAFMQIWGLGDDLSSWWDYSTCSNYGVCGPPGEWFAESYRLCAYLGTDFANAEVPTWSTFGFPGVAAAQQLEASCDLIIAVGQGNGLAIPAQVTYPPPTALAPVTVTPPPATKVKPKHTKAKAKAKAKARRKARRHAHQHGSRLRRVGVREAERVES